MATDQELRQAAAEALLRHLRGGPLPQHVVDDPAELRRAAAAHLMGAEYTAPDAPKPEPTLDERIAAGVALGVAAAMKKMREEQGE
jgi:hypothetical protein